jgi:hypothetical protein
MLGTGRALITLRLAPARNNQVVGTWSAADFLEF